MKGRGARGEKTREEYIRKKILSSLKKKGVDTTEYERNIAKQKKGEKTEEQKSSVLDEIKID